MEDRPSSSLSVYDYSDKSVQQAGIAAIVFGVIALVSALLEYIQFFLYHRPIHNIWGYEDFFNEQWLKHTPAKTAITAIVAIICAIISGILAFRIFRRSKIAIVLMLAFVILPQLYIWFVVHSISGTLSSVVIAAFLLRGAVRIFEKPDDEADASPRI